MKKNRRLALRRNSIKVLEAAHVRRARGGADEGDPLSEGMQTVQGSENTCAPTLHNTESCPSTLTLVATDCYMSGPQFC